MTNNNGWADEPPYSDYWYTARGVRTDAGIFVDAATAEKISAVWRCVNLISGTVANLPFPVYRRLDDENRERARTHPVYRLLNDQANVWQTAYEWRRMMTRHVLMRGNGYSRKVVQVDGSMQLWPLHPDLVRPEQRPDGRIVYHVPREVQPAGILLADEMFHLRGPSDDGVIGLGVLDVAREAFGSALAQERFANKFFSQTPQPGGVLEHPSHLSDEAFRNLQESWIEQYSGANTGKPAVLEEGLQYKTLPIGLTAEQAQLVASREFTRQDIARWFGVPNHFVGSESADTSWGSGIEQLSAGFVTYTLRDWFVTWEQSVARDLILANRVFFAEVLVDGLLRGDSKTRAEVYSTATGGKAWMTVNEVRAAENRNGVPGGDELEQPAPPSAPSAPPPSTNGNGNGNGASRAELERLQTLVRSYSDAR